MRILPAIIFLSGLLFLQSPVSAFTLKQNDALSWFERKYIPIKISCIGIIKKSGREHLVNNCNRCLVVQIKRIRPGRSEGALRKITIGAKQSSTLSFRGPGITRISAEITCAKAKSLETPKEEDKPKAKPMKCLRVVKHKKAGALMVNSCGKCRKAVVERRYKNGSRKLANLSIAENSYVPVQILGATNVRIINEKSCR